MTNINKKTKKRINFTKRIINLQSYQPNINEKLFKRLCFNFQTAFNYGFAGSQGVGKSALINGIRAISSKHPLAAGRTKIKPGFCQRHEFDDDVLAYSVTLWELHYPKKISAFFEFIE